MNRKFILVKSIREIYKKLNILPGIIKVRIELALKENPNNLLYKLFLRSINSFLKLPRGHNIQLMTIDDNDKLNSLEMKRGDLHVQSTPLEIEIGTTMVCNIDPPCVQCPKHIHPRFGYVNKTAFHIKRAYIKRMAPFINLSKIASLHGFGEPLTCSYLFDSLEYVKSKTYSCFCSNGILLNDKIIEKIIEKRVSNVNFSLDAATKETYFKIRHHDFNQTLNNIKNLIAARDKAKLEVPSISINMTLMRENIKEFPGFVELAKQLGAEVHIYRLAHGPDYKYEWFDYKLQHCENDPETHDYYIEQGYKLAAELGVKIMYTGAQTLSKNDSTYLYLSNKINTNMFFCEFPWKHVFIDTDGSVYNCCWQPQPIGHLKDSSFWQIWNGDLVKSIRKSTAKGIPHSLCNHGGSTCPFVSSYLATNRMVSN